MDIASLVIRAKPDQLAGVRERLEAIPGVEVAASSPEGRLAVTVEDRPGLSFEQTLLDIHRVEGVLSATLVYQYSEPAAEPLEAKP